METNKITFATIMQQVEYLENEMEIVDSMAYVTYMAAASNVPSAGEFTGTLQLLTIKTREVCKKIKELNPMLVEHNKKCKPFIVKVKSKAEVDEA